MPIATATALPSIKTATPAPATSTSYLTKTPLLIPRPTDFPLPTPTLGIGSTIISEKDGMVMVYVPAGEFIMGSDSGSSDEQPVHTVYLNAFWIDQTEVTNEMYSKCVEAQQCYFSGRSYDRFHDLNYANYPVTYVSWEDANSYCSWAGRRLPTEAEWEKAARGIDGSTYPWGETIDCLYANYWVKDGFCIGDTTPVGSYENGKSLYGAYDMAGNVWEWVADWYSKTYYQISPFSNPLGSDFGQFRVLRGGAWNYNKLDVRSTARNKDEPEDWFGNVGFGFRCARSP